MGDEKRDAARDRRAVYGCRRDPEAGADHQVMGGVVVVRYPAAFYFGGAVRSD